MKANALPPALLAALAAALLATGCGDDSSSEETASSEPFAPRASLTAIGPTARTTKPEVVLRVEARPGDAPIRSANVTLPAAFLVDQGALAVFCSESELREKACAGRKRLGAARAVSPAYDAPLTGPVYAVTGSGGLPRLAFVLGGPADLLLRGRIAVRGTRLRAGVEDVPDTPLSTFVLRIDGGPSGYLIVSRDLCAGDPTANVSFTGQSDETFRQTIPLRADCDA